MGDAIKLDIHFSALGDLLSMWAPDAADKSGARIVTMHPDISSFHSAEGQCIGIYWFDARRILLPLLERGNMAEVERYPDLLVDYCRETDTLTFGNREAAVISQEMSSELVVNFDHRGSVCSFTMGKASDILLHHFRNPIDKDGSTPVGSATSEAQE